MYQDKSYQNDVLGCLSRECGVFNGQLFAYCMMFGGVAGLIILYAINGGSFEPSGALRFNARKLQKRIREGMQDMIDQAEGNGPNESDDQDTTLDLTDGIEEGEEGIILQLLANYLCNKAAKTDESRLRNLATLFVAIAFLKKLGLKLIIVIPLILIKNWISAAPYVLDLVVLVYFGMNQKYFPGSLYNEIHTLLTGRKYKKVPSTFRFLNHKKSFPAGL